MLKTPDYLFLKQSASLKSYFGELCLDVSGSTMAGAVFSEIPGKDIGNVRFESAPAYRRNSFKARVFSWVKYFGAATWFAFTAKGQPLLFIVAQPPILPLLGYLQKRLSGRRYVVWIDDVYPDVLVRRGVLSSSGWMVRAWCAFNRETLKHAEHVFTLGPHMREAVRQYLPPELPVSIIPTWVDTDVIRPIPRSENSWARTHGLDGKFVVMYSGNFGATHDVDLLVDAARLLRDRTNLHFVLIGSGAKWNSIEASLRDDDKNISLLPWQLSEVLSETLSCADISFVSLSEGAEGVSMPSKTYYAMAAGSAIMASCSEESDLAEVVRRSACGVVVRPNVVEDIVDSCERLVRDPSALTTCKANARSAAVNLYSRHINARIVREIVEQIAVSPEGDRPAQALSSS